MIIEDAGNFSSFLKRYVRTQVDSQNLALQFCRLIASKRFQREPRRPARILFYNAPVISPGLSFPVPDIFLRLNDSSAGELSHECSRQHFAHLGLRQITIG
jgi:hypothetical protein